MLRAAAAPTERALGETNASGTVLPPQSSWRINEGWFAAILLVVMVLSTIWSIHSANWVEGTQVLFAMALAGIIMGLVVARQAWRTWQALLAGVLVGGLLAYTVIGEIFPTPREWPSGIGTLISDTGSWMQAGETREGLPPPLVSVQGVATEIGDFALRIAAWSELAWYARPSTDNGIFLLLMSLLAWGLGYIGAWGLFRLHDVVIASLPTGIALVTNASYTGQAQAPFAIFLISLLLLAVSINLYALRSRWEKFSVDYPGELLFDVVVTSFAVIVVLALLSMLGPRVINNPLSIAFWRYIGEQWTELENVTNRLFAGISSPGTRFAAEGARGSLVLSGPINLTQRQIMSVLSQEPHYWRGSTFDTYTGRAWRNSDAVVLNRTPEQPVTEVPGITGKRVQTVFDIEPSMSTVIYAPVEPVELSIRYQKLAPSGKADVNDFSALYSRRPAMPSLRYAVESLIPEPSIAELRQASTEYPDWIKDRYLQLPDVTDRVLSLSESLTRDRETVYDKAVSIEQFIRRYQYTLATPVVPEGWDAVDFFLFESKVGYCDYFASAMVLLLRLQGVPARMATGFVAGTLNNDTGRYEVTEEDLHSWPEVYFPAYGWIAFEPSGYRAEINRPESAADLSAADPDIDEALDEELEELALLLGLEDPPVTGADLVSAAASWRPSLPNVLPAIVVIVAAFGLYRLIRLLRERRMPSREMVRRLYRRMVFLGGLLGRKRRPAETPLEYAAALTREMQRSLEQERNGWLKSVMEVPDDAAQRIAASYVRAQYGQRSPSDTERTEVEEAWRNLWWHLPLLLVRERVRTAPGDGRRVPAGAAADMVTNGRANGAATTNGAPPS